jgi:hypothetical protein
MLEGRTADCLAIAIPPSSCGSSTSSSSAALLVDKAPIPCCATPQTLSQICPNADHSNFEEAIRIIRQELMPRLAEPVRAR